MTDIDVYQPANGIGQYQAGIVMTPEQARALDEQVRRCTEAVLREGTDYGIIPGTNGEKTLWRPGAQKLLQWFSLECTCERIEVERDDDGRKHGITYRAEVGRGLKTATPVILATCEGTADYDESKFHQSEEQVRARLRDAEHKWAAKDRRVPNADRWNNAKEYRADWNALMKRAQKRAIVGAVNDATAAGGIFSDREEDEPPVPQDDGPTWYEQSLEAALSFTDLDTGNQLFVDAAHAARDGLCTPRQATHIQNRIRQRGAKLKNATAADVEELAGQAASAADEAGEPNGQQPPEASPRTARRKTAAAGDSTRSQHRDQAPRTAEKHGADTAPAAAGDAPSRGAQPLPPLPGEDDETGGPGHADSLEPGEAAEFGTERHRALVGIVWQHLGRLGYPGDKQETDEEKAARLADVATLAGVSEIGSTSDLDTGELSAVADTLSRCKNRDKLKTLLDAARKGGGDE